MFITPPCFSGPGRKVFSRSHCRRTPPLCGFFVLCFTHCSPLMVSAGSRQSTVSPY
ncbi:hypothetical protein LINGRAHAP2_LOCUS23391 [Linum grandiflorum]